MITCAAEQIAYKRCQDSWGGATLYVPTNQFLADNVRGYVFAVGEVIEMPEDADYFEFRGAVAKLTANYPDAVYFGFFHDNRKGTIDLNPVMFAETKAEVDAAFAAGNPITGGAYELHTGDGYWPQGRPELYV